MNKPRSFRAMALFPLVMALVLIPCLLRAQEPEPDPEMAELDKVFAKADQLFKEENWAEARDAYDAIRKSEENWRSLKVRRAVDGAVTSLMKLNLWDEALERPRELIGHTTGTLEEALAQRYLAGLYLTVPHQGVKQGGVYKRGQHGQGVWVSSWKKDCREAVTHYERAREIILGLLDKPDTDPDRAEEKRAQRLTEELIGVNFDLAGALAQSKNDPNYGHYGQFGICGWWWPSWAEDEEDSEAVEEADYEEPRYYRGWGGQEQEPPTGIPLGSDGNPQFLKTPDAYSANLGAGPKIRFLLEEIQRLDPTEKKEFAADALYRWGVLARTMYGPEIIQQLAQHGVRYDSFGRALPPEEDPDAPQTKIWELSPDQALTYVGGRLRVVDLPKAESPLAIFRQVEEKFPDSEFASKAVIEAGFYLQSRQQFPAAISELERAVAEYKIGDGLVSQQLKFMREPNVMLSESTVQLPGDQIRLDFEHRNMGEVKFTAYRFDLARFIREDLEDTSQDYWNYRNFQYRLLREDQGLYKKYTKEKLASWAESVLLDDNHRAAKGHTIAPLSEPGAYLIEATGEGAAQVSRTIVLVTDIAIVRKNLKGKGLIYICDARTGQPLPEKSVRVYEHWRTYPKQGGKHTNHYRVNTIETNAEGVIEYKRREENSQVEAVVSGKDNRFAFSHFQNWSEHAPSDSWENGARYYVVTDRPVYRPGETVKFRAWIREKRDRVFREPFAGNGISVKLYDARNNEGASLQLSTDAMGGVSGEFTLGDEPALGVYHLRVSGSQPDARHYAGGIFRVEEYKKPEFEVTVKPSTTQAKLGDKFKATISARYYFGQPVASGTVTYKVFREDYRHVYYGPGEYDWLYGAGYGRYRYAYPWMPWWGRWGCFIWDDTWPWPHRGIGYINYPWGGYGNSDDDWQRRGQTTTRKALRELVAQGTAELKPDGTYEVEIDSAKAARELPNTDHRYTIEAEVRDASRRTITGQGSVVATRQAFYAFIETNGGWYTEGTEALVNVRTLTPDNVPVTTPGEVTVARISFADGQLHSTEEVLKRWDAETDAEGRLAFRYAIPGGGQYRITFRAKDAWGGEVQGNAIFWARGPDFDGRVYRFNDLEVIADKRSYKVGEVAHLLINCAENDSRVLFSDHVSGGTLLEYRLLDLSARSTVIEIPIEERHVPNFFVEATLVRNGKLHLESRELFVPPVKGLLDVKITTDKEIYRAGDKGTVRVSATDHQGKPAAGEVALTIYDQAVTYIQDEFGPSPRVFYHGQKRYHRPFAESSTELRFSVTGTFRRPEQEASSWQYYRGNWSNSGSGWGPARRGLALNRSRDEVLVGQITATGRLEQASSLSVAAAAPAPANEAMAMQDGDMRAGGGGFFGAAGAEKKKLGEKEDQSGPDGGPALLEPEIRANFSDTAFWGPTLKLDAEGAAEAEVTFPQSLTTWRVRGYAMNTKTQVGDATAHATTTKNLIVRLQAPRFFMERDEVVLSANVNNYLPTAQKVRAELYVPAELFQFMGDMAGEHAPDAEGNQRLLAEAEVAANGEHRFDWPVKVLKPGFAKITVKALTTEESDGMRMAFPVLVHGINKTVAQSGAYRVDAEGVRTIKVDLPMEIDPEQTRLELTLAPSLAGVMFDALPYLAGYPYGCVEQTMSRFYPSVLVRDSLKKMGTNLETVAERRKQLNPDYLAKRFGGDPVFDTEELDRMVRAGLTRIYNFQQPDGGWGWWREDSSSPYQTAYVIQGLHAARQAGVNVDEGIYWQGYQFLRNHINAELDKEEKDRKLGTIQTQAYLAYVLTLEKDRLDDDAKKWLTSLYEQRGSLNNYGRAQLALAMHNLDRADEAQMLLRNLLQYVERDDSNETAWVRTPTEGWWFWWNNDIETNAWALKAIVTLEPKSDLAPRLVKWLMNNRANGYYWRSTRDTALVIAAMTDYMQASGEAKPEYTLAVSIDGDAPREFRVTAEDMLAFDGRVVLHGLQLKPGPHEITLTKTGKGALYYSCYLSYFTKEEDIKGAGNEVFVTREYFKLVPKTEQVRLPDQAMVNTPAANQPDALGTTGHTELRAGFTRVPLNNGDAVTSGDQIEVVLKITAKNTYDYLAFEDMKPAGCEPVELRSGGRWAGGLCANTELRDEKVVFFIGLLEQGEHILRYKLRAEIPGKFHALPTSASAMYAPEIRAISDEMQLEIKDL